MTKSLVKKKVNEDNSAIKIPKSESSAIKNEQENFENISDDKVRIGDKKTTEEKINSLNKDEIHNEAINISSVKNNQIFFQKIKKYPFGKFLIYDKSF